MSKKVQTILFLSLLFLIFISTYVVNEKKRLEKLSDPHYLTDQNRTWQNTLEDDKLETWAFANSYCKSLQVDEVIGSWDLPTKAELYEAYKLNSKFKNRARGLHWSSTPVEGNKKLAYCILFDGGMAMTFTKTKTARIKCVNRHSQSE